MAKIFSSSSNEGKFFFRIINSEKVFYLFGEIKSQIFTSITTRRDFASASVSLDVSSKREEEKVLN